MMAANAADASTIPVPQPEHEAGKARALPLIAASISSGVALGLTWYNNAATPATCGVAMEVPE